MTSERKCNAATHAPSDPIRVLLVSPWRALQRRFEGLGQRLKVLVAAQMAEALVLLRTAPQDVAVVHHEPDDVDAFQFLRVLQTDTADLPCIVLGRPSAGSLAAACFDAGAEEYLRLEDVTPALMGRQLQRAVERARLKVENRQLRSAEQRRLEKDYQQANHLLSRQRRMLSHLMESPHPAVKALPLEPPNRPQTHLPPRCAALANGYADMLRASVVGDDNDSPRQIRHFAEIIWKTSLSSQEVLLLHHHVLKNVLTGLGLGSVQRVTQQADRLLVELMANLVTAYQSNCQPKEELPVRARRVRPRTTEG